MLYSFTLHAVIEGDFPVDDLVEQIYSKSDDSTVSVETSNLRIGFDRESSCLRTAIASAVNEIEGLGVQVSRVSVDPRISSTSYSSDELTEVNAINLFLPLRATIKSQADLDSLWQDFSHAS